ncbi:unnamed protein product [Heterobilharzia americana]|nr:unnamed protein product [Heterobilharzia americana]
MSSDVIQKPLKQVNSENENLKANDTEINREDKHWSKISSYNLRGIKRSENSTHVTGKNSCIETDFKREMKRYYVGLKQNLDRIDRNQEEVAIKMNRLYRESRKLARRSRNEKKQSFRINRRHSTKYKKEDSRVEEERQKDKESYDHLDEEITEAEITNQLILSPWLPVIHPNKIVCLTTNANSSAETERESKDEVKTELVKPDVSKWLTEIKEEKNDASGEEQEPIKTPQIDISAVQNQQRCKYSIHAGGYTRRSINYSLIKHKESHLSHLKAALSEKPIAYLWKNKSSTSHGYAKLTGSKFQNFDLQAKRCIPGSVGGASNYFLEATALPKPALVRFPPPTSMHEYKRKKMLVIEKEHMQNSLFRLSQVIEEMKRILESQKLMAALKFLLASTMKDNSKDGTRQN